MLKNLLSSIALSALMATGAFAESAWLEHEWWEEATIEKVQAELDAGARLDERNDTLRTPLHAALQEKPGAELIRFLIANGAPLQPLNGKGEPLGMTAARRSSLEIMTLLKEAGVDFSLMDYELNGPLHYVARNATYEPGMLEFLMVHGLDPNAQNRNGETPAMIAAINTDGAQVYADLVALGSDPSGIDAQGNDIWMRAIRRNENPAMLEMFYGMSEDPEAENSAGLSGILLLADRRINEAGLKFLEDKGFDIHATGPNGENAMILNAKDGDEDSLKLLADRGFAVNVVDDNGNTPVLNAAMHNDYEIVTALIEAGGDVAVVNDRGMTPLLALLDKSEEAGSEDEAALQALIDLVISKGADPLASDKAGASALIHAVKSRQPLARINMLIAAGVDVNAKDAEATTALMHAAMVATDPAVLEALLAAGADKSVQDAFEDTAQVLADDNTALKDSAVLALLN